jgi:hypothetical protein
MVAVGMATISLSWCTTARAASEAEAAIDNTDLMRRESLESANELWRTDLESGKRERAFPNYSMVTYDISSDGKRYRFKLIKGVQFHNGRELTASDFKYTLERSSSKQIGSWVQNFLSSVVGHSAFAAGKAKQIAGIKVVDKYTLELRLTKPDVTIPGVLATPPFYALPQEELKKQGKNFTFNPVGTGPFKMERWDKSKSRYTAVRNPDYVYGKTLHVQPEYDHEIETDIAAWFENDGEGGGWTRHVVTTASNGSISAAAADFDHDGDLDVLSAGTLGGSVEWTPNLGTKVFDDGYDSDANKACWSSAVP